MPGGISAPREPELHDAAPGPGGGVHDHRRATVDADRGAQRVQCSIGEPLGDLRGLCKAVQHGVAHLVDRARADRVVGAVADDLEPRLVEQRRGPVVSGQEQRRQGLGQALERSLRAGGGLLHVDAVRRHAHEQVGTGTGAELALPRRKPVRGSAAHVLGERADVELVAEVEVVRLGYHPAEPRLRHEVVGAVHPEDRAGEQVALLLLELGDAAHERLGVVGHEGAVAVALREVLGPHRGAVRCRPPEAAPVDRRRHAPPHHRVLVPEQPEQLWHLCHVAEHVGQVAHIHGAAEAAGHPQPPLQVAHERLAGHEELVGQRVPRPHRHAAGGGQRAQPRLGLGPDGEVVVDHGHLPVEEEVGVGRVSLELRQQLVEQVDEAQPERLVRRVPLAVPVGVRDDVHPPLGALTCCFVVAHDALRWPMHTPTTPAIPPPMIANSPTPGVTSQNEASLSTADTFSSS